MMSRTIRECEGYKDQTGGRGFENQEDLLLDCGRKAHGEREPQETSNKSEIMVTDGPVKGLLGKVASI